MVAVDTAADTDQDTDQPWARGQAAPAASVAVVGSNAIPWTGTPLTVELQPADEATDGAADEVDIAPQQLQLTPDSIGQDYVTVHIVNQSAEEQVLIVSAQLPETIALYVIQDEPHSATLHVTMDATHEATDDQDATDGPALHITTPSGITTVQVT